MRDRLKYPGSMKHDIILVAHIEHPRYEPINRTQEIKAKPRTSRSGRYSSHASASVTRDDRLHGHVVTRPSSPGYHTACNASRKRVVLPICHQFIKTC